MTIFTDTPVADSISFGKTVENVMKEIMENEQDSSFYMLDLDSVIERIEYWQASLPRVQPYYAIKCNDCPEVVSTLAAFGTGFSCVNKAQIELALKSGAIPSNIICSSPIPTKSLTKYACSKGTGLLTFDSKIELENAKAVFPNAKLLLKVRVDERGTIDKLAIKFGADLDEVFSLLQYAKDLGIDVAGISFSVRRGCWERRIYKEAFEISSNVFEFAKTLGFQFTILDIGGGFPCFDGTTDLFDEVCDVINENLALYFPPHSGVSIMAEPGRYFVSNAFTLCTKIMKKSILQSENDNEYQIVYYIKEGIHGTFSSIFFGNDIVLPKSAEEPHDNTLFYPSIIRGSSTDSWDQVIESCQLPSLVIGDYLIFENMGAYTGPSNMNAHKINLHIVSSKSNLMYFRKT